MNSLILHASNENIDSSKINDFIKCPRYYMQRYLFGWRSITPANHLAFGEAWHLALEHLMTSDYKPNNVLKAYEIMYHSYRQKFPEDSDEMFEPKTMNNALIVLNAYVQKYHRDLEQFKVLYTEVAGSIMINEHSKITFRMDSICQDLKSGKVFSLEHKTGSSEYLWLDQWLLSIQFGTYTHVLMCLYPYDQIDAVYANGTFFKKSKGGWEELNTYGALKKIKVIPYNFIREPIKKSRDQMAVWLETINYYYDRIKEETELFMNSNEDSKVLKAFPLNPSSCISYGRICEYRDFCLAWPNPLRRYNPNEAPLGFQFEFWNPLEREAKQVFNI